MTIIMMAMILTTKIMMTMIMVTKIMMTMIMVTMIMMIMIMVDNAYDDNAMILRTTRNGTSCRYAVQDIHARTLPLPGTGRMIRSMPAARW